MTHYSKYKDYKNRQNLKKNYINIFVLKYLLKNSQMPKYLRFKVMWKIQKLHDKTHFNKVKNRCITSTKVRSISRISNFSKGFLKNHLSWGKINGFKKASW